MADTKSASASRGRYSSAGYKAGEKDLYISRPPAGSAQEDLRDLNKPGYRVARPWNESPEPVLEMRTAAPEKSDTRRRKKESFVEYMIREARLDRRGVIVCVALLCAFLMMVAAFLAQLSFRKHIADETLALRKNAELVEYENKWYNGQLEMASSGERIRNLAQNELGMLRPERADRQTIYVTTPNNYGLSTQQETGEPKMDVLDILLGLLDVFNIGE